MINGASLWTRAAVTSRTTPEICSSCQPVPRIVHLASNRARLSIRDIGLEQDRFEMGQ